jgi:photosystem II stability/assembly factor-like uncharacterized protein
MPPGNLLQLLTDPALPGVLYARADSSTLSSYALYRSPDGGQTWAVLDTAPLIGGPACLSVPCSVKRREPAPMTASPVVSNTLFIGGWGYTDTVACSTDGGRTWAAYGQGSAGLDIHDLAVAEEPGVAYALTTGGDLYRTASLTDTWTYLAHFTATLKTNQRLAAAQATGDAAPPTVTTGGDGHLVYVVDAAQVLHASADGGQTWQTRTLLGAPQAVLVRGDTAYVAASGYGLLRSTDAGAAWEQAWPLVYGSRLAAGPGWLALADRGQVARLHDQGSAWTADYLDPVPGKSVPPSPVTRGTDKPPAQLAALAVDAGEALYAATVAYDSQTGGYQYALYRYPPPGELPGPYRVYLPFISQPLSQTGHLAPPYQVALDRINYWRGQAGLRPVHDHPALRCAAANHARYLDLHYAATGEAHYEAPELAGFTGVQPGDRAAFCGCPDPWRETDEVVVPPPGTDAASAVDWWLSSVYHRGGVLDPATCAVGYGEGGANVLDCRPGGALAGWPPASSPLADRQPSRRGDWQPARHTRFVLWPYPGQTDVPPLWDGREIPSPLPAGAALPVGYPVSLVWDKGLVTPTLALLEGPTGAVPCYEPPPPRQSSGRYYAFLVPTAPLAPRTAYTATVAGESQDGPFAFTWSFTTAASAIFGGVADHGQPAAGVLLELRRLDSPQGTVVATATTTLDGRYVFPDPPLDATYMARVAYQNDGSVPGRLRYWYTSPFRYDPASSTVIQWGGDFDLADVALGEPDTTAPLPEPVTFRWTPRDIADETYTIQFRDPATDEFRASVDLTAEQSAAGWVSLTRPADLPPGTYTWTIRIQGPHGSGRAGTTHTVTW